MRILVTGGRGYSDKTRVFEVLDRYRDKFGVDLVIQGGATGADALAKYWADARDIPCLRVPALWRKLGDAAGPERNRRMLALGRPDKVIAFAGGAGTRNMVELARAEGIEVFEIPERRP